MSRSVEIIVPWWPHTDSLHRTEACGQVLAHLNSAATIGSYDFATKVSVCSVADGEAWSPGRARNRGAAASTADLLVFNDADSIVTFRQLEQTIETAFAHDGLVYGYDLYVRQGPDGKPLGEPLFNPPSMGCAAIRKDCFDELAGFNPEFEGWGYEDVEFAGRAAARFGGVQRVSGPLYHLWHGERRPDDSPADSDPSQVERNLALWQRSTS